MTTTTVGNSRELNLGQMIDGALDFDAALHAALEEVGETFGLYDTMAQSGPITPACLAAQAGISQQAARTWLDALAAGNYLKHCRRADLYCLWCSWPRRPR